METDSFIQTLQFAPFPYSGKVEDTEVDFFDTVDPESGERFHTNRHGVRCSESEHYRDGSVLFQLPAQFDPRRPFAYVLFFHGHGTDLSASERDHELRRQVESSGSNVVLIVPQLAHNAADSSPGKFSEKDAFRVFMGEVSRVLTSKIGHAFQHQFDTAPIILSAFSGGYKAVAYVLDRGGSNDRVKGVLLMDALYDDVDKFERWIAGNIQSSFLVVLYTRGSCEENMQDLLGRLTRRGIHPAMGWPQALVKGTVCYDRVLTGHRDIPRLGPPRAPLASLLHMWGRW